MSKQKKDLSELDADLFSTPQFDHEKLHEQLDAIESTAEIMIPKGMPEGEEPPYMGMYYPKSKLTKFFLPAIITKAEGLNNEIQWKENTEQAYDGSEIQMEHLDPAYGPRYFKSLIPSEVDKYGFPDVTPEQAKAIGDIQRRKLNRVNQSFGEAVFKAEKERAANPDKPYVHWEAPRKEKLYLGIDPGKSGGIVGLDLHGGFIKSIIPVLGDDVDIHALYAFFTPLKEKYNCTLILEDVHSMFKMSAGSNFTFGFVCGAIEAIVIAHGFKLIKIAPKRWQNELWQNSDKQYKPLEKGQKNPSINTKLTSLICAKRLFPQYDFRKSNSPRVKNDHDGIVDACLIAEYGRRKNL